MRRLQRRIQLDHVPAGPPDQPSPQVAILHLQHTRGDPRPAPGPRPPRPKAARPGAVQEARQPLRPLRQPLSLLPHAGPARAADVHQAGRSRLRSIIIAIAIFIAVVVVIAAVGIPIVTGPHARGPAQRPSAKAAADEPARVPAAEVDAQDPPDAAAAHDGAAAAAVAPEAAAEAHQEGGPEQQLQDAGQ